ncbi:MAG: nucleotide exchange factor GrpE [Dysgonamonadaceae bacterium]|jgi:molecular chaperone GrpE|nr:nucleotide exchange factor GrpE [Dysgonamonadaceae bacterium]
MNKKDWEDKPEKEAGFADNLTDNLSKEQAAEEPQEDASENPDNVSETPEEPDAAEALDKLKDSYLRLMAEYDNYRKRTIKEKADLIKNGGEKVLTGLLPVVDDLQRALENVDNARDLDAVKEGVRLIYQKFLAFLQQNGVKAIETAGELFDADLHEAIATVPAPADDQKGKIIDNIQTGYTLNDKVIRHAKVVVAN